jgi:hypothetical protein
VRDEPLHPRYRKRATEREKKLGRRYQLVATSTQGGQVAWLDARHRSHVHVGNDFKQAKALGLNRWPSRHWAVNVAARGSTVRGPAGGAVPPSLTACGWGWQLAEAGWGASWSSRPGLWRFTRAGFRRRR